MLSLAGFTQKRLRKGYTMGNFVASLHSAKMISICLIIGLVTWTIIFFSTRYVALASIGFGISLPVCALVNSWMVDQPAALGKVILALVIMIWIVWRHRSNISRLRQGTENRFKKK